MPRSIDGIYFFARETIEDYPSFQLKPFPRFRFEQKKNTQNSAQSKGLKKKKENSPDVDANIVCLS